MEPVTYLIRDDHTPAKPAYPVIDAHNHLWSAWESLKGVAGVMDECGVVAYCDLTSNITISWGGGGYILGQGDIGDFNKQTASYPGRFYGFTTSRFAQPHDAPLFDDPEQFVSQTIDLLREHINSGARGLKILKELGLIWRDSSGKLISVDDPRLFEIWEEPARLGVPVLIHQADPVGFFDPPTPDNEHYDSLMKYPAWQFHDRSRFPTHFELLQRLLGLIEKHPNTTFLLPHGANWPENLRWLSALLDAHPNVFLDFSARCDELGRQPYRSREFILKYQDRILFGTDMPASVELYRFHFRFFETFDEFFIPPDYDGTFGRHRWKVCGLGLPKDTLKKLYFENAISLIPGLRDDLRGVI